MNTLRLHTVPEGDGFLVRWSTGMATCGIVRTNGLSEMTPADARIAAELSVLRYLLVEREVSGHDKTGAGLQITLTSGAAKKLLRESSDKVHLVPYANFLRTRFLGAEIQVEHSSDWFDPIPVLSDEHYDIVPWPAPETLPNPELGAVEITGHAMDRFVERFAIAPTKGWRRMADSLATSGSRELTPSLAKMLKQLKHKAKDTVILACEKRKFLFVIALHQGPQKRPRCVTCYSEEEVYC